MEKIARMLCIKFYGVEWVRLRNQIESISRAMGSGSQSIAPIHAQKLLISGEDHRNLRHPGYDLIAISRAIWRYISRGSLEGASTIEQQIVRTLTGRYDRTLSRKLKEILLASMVARHFGKRMLPGFYLHIGYFGWNMHGYVAACERFGFDPGNLSLEEAAVIVARLKYPETRKLSSVRASQIERRKRHLLNLHKLHESAGLYG